MIQLARILAFLKTAARASWVWSALVALCLGVWLGYGFGHDAGHTEGVTVGRQAERARQAEAALDGSRDAIRDREAAEDEAMDEFDRAGGDLERLCKADPACRDRHGLRLD